MVHKQVSRKSKCPPGNKIPHSFESRLVISKLRHNNTAFPCTVTKTAVFHKTVLFTLFRDIFRLLPMYGNDMNKKISKI
jgi:hypothetical protein